MGRIARLKTIEAKRTGQFPNLSPRRSQGAAVWEEVFGRVSTDRPRAYQHPPITDSTYGRSMVGTDVATKRLVAALRSKAPGGWSDDRWEQAARQFQGVTYVAIDRIARQWQQAEFQIFKKDRSVEGGKRPVTEDDPPEGKRFCQPYDAVKLLERPNPRDSFGKLAYRWCQQLRLTGMALTWMLPNELGTPMQLFCIPTAVAIPQAVTAPEYPEGFYRIQPVYPYGPFSSYPTPFSSVGAPIPAQWMLRFTYPHPILWYDGFSPLTALRHHIDVVTMIDRSRHYSMRRSVNPSAVLQMDEMSDGMEPLNPDEVERIKADFEGDFEGPENHGRLFIAAPGGRLEAWGGKPNEMEWESGWDQLVGFVMGGLGITKQAAGMIDDATYATLFATLKQLHLITVQPDLDDVAADITRNLLPFFGDDLIMECRCPRIDDHEVTFKKVEVLISAKAVTKNQVRKMLDEPLTQEPWGDEMAGEGEEEKAAAKAAEMGMPGAGGPTDQGDKTPDEKERPKPGQEGPSGRAMKTLVGKRGRKGIYEAVSNRIKANGRAFAGSY